MQKQQKQIISIIIPCYNESSYIKACLDSILANDYDKSLLEILIIDGMSTDGTREIIFGYIERWSCIKIIDNPQYIKPISLNIGIKMARGDIIMRIDAHAIYPQNYISLLVKDLEKYQVDNVGALRKTFMGHTVWENAIAIVISHPFAVGNAYWRTHINKPKLVDTVFCGCYKRKVFEMVGLFNEKLIRTQDRELNIRLRQHGGKILLDPAIQCIYFPRTNLWGYIKWIYQGAFWVQYARAFTSVKMFSWRNLIPVVFVLWHLWFILFCFFSLPICMLVSLPLILYWIINFVVSCLMGVKRKRLLLAPLLFLLFPITHYSYGFGSIIGFIKSKLVKR